MENLKMHTPDLAEENYRKLAELSQMLSPKPLRDMMRTEKPLSNVPLTPMCCGRKLLLRW